MWLQEGAREGLTVTGSKQDSGRSVGYPRAVHSRGRREEQGPFSARRRAEEGRHQWGLFRRDSRIWADTVNLFKQVSGIDGLTQGLSQAVCLKTSRWEPEVSLRWGLDLGDSVVERWVLCYLELVSQPP